jgi:hypothetical protein
LPLEWRIPLVDETKRAFVPTRQVNSRELEIADNKVQPLLEAGIIERVPFDPV